MMVIVQTASWMERAAVYIPKSSLHPDYICCLCQKLAKRVWIPLNDIFELVKPLAYTKAFFRRILPVVNPKI